MNGMGGMGGMDGMMWRGLIPSHPDDVDLLT
jgi:hypothetical protein